MNSKPLIILVALVLVTIVAVVAWYNQRTLVSGLPPRTICLDEADAKWKAGDAAIGVLGTGSMAPYLPAAAPGKDPMQTVVAYVQIGGRFEDVKVGQLVIYRYADKVHSWMHVAAMKTDLGFVMSGLANANSEPWGRVTKDNFIGIVERVFVW